MAWGTLARLCKPFASRYGRHEVRTETCQPRAFSWREIGPSARGSSLKGRDKKMGRISEYLAVLALLAGPVAAAKAQITTLTDQGDPISGTGSTMECCTRPFDAAPQLTTDGKITGPTLDYRDFGYHLANVAVDIGRTGDSYDHGSADGCTFATSQCLFEADMRDTKRGTWSATAPEIDPASFGGGLTPLLGGLLVLRGRRNKPRAG